MSGKKEGKRVVKKKHFRMSYNLANKGLRWSNWGVDYEIVEKIEIYSNSPRQEGRWYITNSMALIM